MGPRLRQLFKVACDAVIEIARDEHDVRLKRSDPADDTPHETAIAHMAKVKVAYQCGRASTALRRQIGEANADSGYARPGGIQHTIDRTHDGSRQKQTCNPWQVPACPGQQSKAVNGPRQIRC